MVLVVEAYIKKIAEEEEPNALLCVLRIDSPILAN